MARQSNRAGAAPTWRACEGVQAHEHTYRKCARRADATARSRARLRALLIDARAFTAPATCRPDALEAAGYDVVALTRDPLRARRVLPPTVSAAAPEGWRAAMRGAAAVINLAGEPISTRWSDSIKREIKVRSCLRHATTWPRRVPSYTLC